jgi:hypothetical protein
VGRARLSKDSRSMGGGILAVRIIALRTVDPKGTAFGLDVFPDCSCSLIGVEFGDTSSQLASCREPSTVYRAVYHSEPCLLRVCYTHSKF